MLQKAIGWPLSITEKAITRPQKSIRRKLMTIPSLRTNIPKWRIKRAAARNHQIFLAWRALAIALKKSVNWKERLGLNTGPFFKNSDHRKNIAFQKASTCLTKSRFS